MREKRLSQEQGWDPVWANDSRIDEYWRTPDQEVIAWARTLSSQGGRRVLDVGCGLGRHVIALARLGFDAAGCDISKAGLARCRDWLAGEGLAATLRHSPMTDLPFPNGSFDAVLSTYVLHHGLLADMQRAVSEIRRVLVPGGRLYASVAARNAQREAEMRSGLTGWREIEPFTFVDETDTIGDKRFPHHYVDEAELRGLLAGFVVDRLRLKSWEDVEAPPDRRLHMHFHVNAHRVE